MADLSSSRTLGKAGAAETARLAKLKADVASLSETRAALLEGSGVASGSRSKSSAAAISAATIVSSGKIQKVSKVKVVATKLSSQDKRPASAGTKRKSQALLNASVSDESVSEENVLDQGGPEEGPETASSLRRGILLSPENVLDQGGPVEGPVTVPSLRRGIPQLPISGGGANLSSLASGPFGLLNEEEEIPLQKIWR